MTDQEECFIHCIHDANDDKLSEMVGELFEKMVANLSTHKSEAEVKKIKEDYKKNLLFLLDCLRKSEKVIKGLFPERQ